MDIVDRLESLGVSLNNSYSRQKTLNDASKEIQTLRAKVASADVLVEALKTIATESPPEIWQVAIKALATYDKLSEVKHGTK